MTKRPRADVTDAELSVMKALWTQGASTIRALTDIVYPGGDTAHYATVQKLLERLRTKGCVHRRRRGRLYIYASAVDKAALIDRRLRSVADTLCEGSLTPLLTHLVDASALSTEDLSTLRELVDSLEKKGRTGR